MSTFEFESVEGVQLMTRTPIVTATFMLLAVMLGPPFATGHAAEPAGSKRTAASGSSTTDKHACPPRYATRGRCTRCKPTRLPCDIEQAKKTRAASKPPQTQKTLPKDWPSPENCKYVSNDDSNWEAEKAACNKAGYPTPLSDRQIGTSPAPASDPRKPTNPVDSAINSAIQSGIDAARQAIDDDVNQAHGGRPTCPSGTDLGQDALSGCRE
jgi:hypothetical protein